RNGNRTSDTVGCRVHHDVVRDQHSVEIAGPKIYPARRPGPVIHRAGGDDRVVSNHDVASRSVSTPASEIDARAPDTLDHVVVNPNPSQPGALPLARQRR